ncbi:MAG: hypothetical protein KPEEDBHJ_02520 [Anaerolineales bacterium]|nr:hypothetical protein [Anaerolineales bacterium]
MARKIGYLLLVVFLLSCGAFLMLYFGGGLRPYIRAVRLVGELSSDKREAAYKKLSCGGRAQNECGGIFAGVTNIIKPMIWVWGRYGLKPFVTDEYSVYWYLQGCGEGLLSQGNTTIPRVRYRTRDDWAKQAQVGDYVMIVVTTEKMGGTKGNLREMAGMDWWSFLQSGMEVECRK